MLQGSPEWHDARRGKLTGTAFRAALAIGKQGQPLKDRRDLVARLVEEIRSGKTVPIETNEYMQHGSRMEPFACMAYEFATGYEVEHAAILQHPTLPYVAFSPDGLIGTDGLLEIKSPALEHRHTRTRDSGKVPDEYMPQCQGGLFVTGRQWVDFVSYFPSIGVEIVRVERNEEYIARIAAACAEVWAEVQNQLNQRNAA